MYQHDEDRLLFVIGSTLKLADYNIYCVKTSDGKNKEQEGKFVNEIWIGSLLTRTTTAWWSAWSRQRLFHVYCWGADDYFMSVLHCRRDWIGLRGPYHSNRQLSPLWSRKYPRRCDTWKVFMLQTNLPVCWFIHVSLVVCVYTFGDTCTNLLKCWTH